MIIAFQVVRQPITDRRSWDRQRQLGRLLLTGAAGGLGKVLRESLQALRSRRCACRTWPRCRQPGPHEEVEPCDLADKAAVDRLVAGCDAIVHMGGVSVERPFEQILEANIKGVFHIYEGARRHGVKRVVFASSNHVIGFHKQDEVLDADCPAPARRLLRPVASPTAKTCRASTSTAMASRPPACASARPFPNPRTAAC